MNNEDDPTGVPPGSPIHHPQQGGFGQAPQGQQQGGFGQAPQGQQGGFGQPPQQAQGGFGQPPQQAQGGFGQPPQQAQGGFGQSPEQGGFGQPQQAQGGFGQPQQGQGGFGQPPQQAQGGFGQPPQGFDQDGGGYGYGGGGAGGAGGGAPSDPPAGLKIAAIILLALGSALTLVGMFPCLGLVNWLAVPLNAALAIVGIVGVTAGPRDPSGRPYNMELHIAAIILGVLLAAASTVRCLAGGGLV